MQLLAHDLQMTFNHRLLFDIAHLRLTQQDRVWLKGANGAGKTTLLKLLAGLTKPNRGRVTLEGAPTRRWQKAGSPLGQVVYLHQSPYLFDGTVLTNLEYGLKNLALTPQARAERISQALDLAQLEHLTEQPAQVLSGGERQRLALARAWVLAPQFLLLDEPTANLDPESITLLTEMVNLLHHQGCGLLITSHQHNELTGQCQTHWRLQQQQLQVVTE